MVQIPVSLNSFINGEKKERKKHVYLITFVPLDIFGTPPFITPFLFGSIYSSAYGFSGTIFHTGYSSFITIGIKDLVSCTTLLKT